MPNWRVGKVGVSRGVATPTLSDSAAAPGAVTPALEADVWWNGKSSPAVMEAADCEQAGPDVWFWDVLS